MTLFTEFLDNLKWSLKIKDWMKKTIKPTLAEPTLS